MVNCSKVSSRWYGNSNNRDVSKGVRVLFNSSRCVTLLMTDIVKCSCPKMIYIIKMIIHPEVGWYRKKQHRPSIFLIKTTDHQSVCVLCVLRNPSVWQILWHKLTMFINLTSNCFMLTFIEEKSPTLSTRPINQPVMCYRRRRFYNSPSCWIH